jgi:WD40 repeat protein
MRNLFDSPLTNDDIEMPVQKKSAVKQHVYTPTIPSSISPIVSFFFAEESHVSIEHTQLQVLLATRFINRKKRSFTYEIVCAFTNGELCVTDCEQGITKQQMTHTGALSNHCVAQLWNGDIVCGYHDGTMRVFDKNSGKQLRVLKKHDQAITCLIQLSDRRLASSSDDGKILIWDKNLMYVDSTIVAGLLGVVCIAEIEGQRMIACYSKEERMVWWDIDTGKRVHFMMTRVLNVDNILHLYEDVIASYGDNRISIRKGSKCRRITEFLGHRGRITGLIKMKENNKIISCGDDGTIRVWIYVRGEEKGQCIRILEGHGPVTSIARLNDNMIASGYNNQTIRVWDILTGKCLNTYKVDHAIQFLTSFYAII